jgi:Fe2+ or Zn2+ uptake regulation protein
MSIVRDGNSKFVSCDSCSDMEELDADLLNEQGMGAAIRAEGYSIHKVNGEWVHTCGSCNHVG